MEPDLCGGTLVGLSAAAWAQGHPPVPVPAVSATIADATKFVAKLAVPLQLLWSQFLLWSCHTS